MAEGRGREHEAEGDPRRPPPGFSPRIATSDDYSARSGLDYHADNVRRFKDSERVKEMIRRHSAPWAQSPDPHLFLRRFRDGSGTNRLWAIHLMNQEQDITHNRWISPDADLERIRERAGHGERPYESTVTVPDRSRVVYDVLDSARIEVSRRNGRIEIPVRVPVWRGRLLALYPEAPTGLRLEAPSTAAPGDRAQLRVAVEHDGEPIEGGFPIAVTVKKPNGQRARPHSRHELARSGTLRLEIPFAENAQEGVWRVRVEELSSGRETEARIRLQGGAR